MRIETRGGLRAAAGIGLGTVGGFAWGVGIRLWMRLISEDPEFSWSGTLFIIGAATIAGTGLALATVARRHHWRFRLGASIAGGLSVLPLGMGAGSILLVTAVLGGIALGRPRIGKVLRLTVLALVLLVGRMAGLETLMGLVLLAIPAALLISGYRPRLVLGALALVPAVFVLAGVLGADLPLWQRLAGFSSYPLFLAPVTIWFGRAVAPIEKDHAAGTIPDP